MTLIFDGKPVDHIIFDFDHTLYPDNDPELENRMWGEIKKKMGEHLAIVNGNSSPTPEESWEMYLKYMDRVPSAGWAGAYFELGGDPFFYNKVVRNNPKAEHLTFDPRLAGLFESLKDRVKILIFSGSSHRTVEEALKVLINDLSLIDRIYGDDDLPEGIQKPGAEAYLKLCELAGIEPERAIMIDDHPAEIATAMKTGMQTLMVGERHSEETRKSVPHHKPRVYEIMDLLS